MSARRTLVRVIRRLHLYLGLGAALYFMLIAATGVALNHREGFHLEEHYFTRGWLPESYRPQDGDEVRADIVVADLHSGLIFGKVGGPVMDVVATVWFLSLLTGLSLAVLGRSIHGARTTAAVSPIAPRPAITASARDESEEREPQVLRK